MIGCSVTIAPRRFAPAPASLACSPDAARTRNTPHTHPPTKPSSPPADSAAYNPFQTPGNPAACGPPLEPPRSCTPTILPYESSALEKSSPHQNPQTLPAADTHSSGCSPPPAICDRKFQTPPRSASAIAGSPPRAPPLRIDSPPSPPPPPIAAPPAKSPPAYPAAQTP